MKLASGSALAFLSLLACATASRQDPAADIGTLGWTASLQQTQQRTGELAPTSQQKATGQVSLLPMVSAPGRMRVQLTISAPGNSSSTLRWAIFPGRCGSPALPLVGVESFPTIDVGSNGRGQVAGELPLRLESGGTYHVNVFKGRGMELSDVLTCGNLRQR